MYYKPSSSSNESKSPGIFLWPYARVDMLSFAIHLLMSSGESEISSRACHRCSGLDFVACPNHDGMSCSWECFFVLLMVYVFFTMHFALALCSLTLSAFMMMHVLCVDPQTSWWASPHICPSQSPSYSLVVEWVAPWIVAGDKISGVCPISVYTSSVWFSSTMCQYRFKGAEPAPDGDFLRWLLYQSYIRRLERSRTDISA